MIASHSSMSKPLVSVTYARQHELFLEKTEDRVTAYITSNTKPEIILEAQRIGGIETNIQRVVPARFTETVNQYFEAATSNAKTIADQVSAGEFSSINDVVKSTQDLLAQSDESAPVVRLINAVLVDAIKQRASDVHIETYGDYFSIRYRVDGVLQDVAQPTKALVNALVSRIKVMANMDIAEKRIPQDGSIAVTLSHREVDVRISTLPTRYGERVVMRLLNKDTTDINLENMGLNTGQRNILLKALERPQGLVLVTGPTGSGKSTTLYAGLRQVDTGSKNILTVEDPIEYELPGVGQTQVNVKSGMTFAKTLRAMLRQDPDVVMVGEIRDKETAQTAIQASLTGHLVLSTLHTNTAIGAVTRLIDMGVEPFLLASTIELLVGQRLVRTLCPKCCEARSPTVPEAELLASHQISCMGLFRAVGCAACNGKGYLGRGGIFEVIALDQSLRAMIHDGSAEAGMLASMKETRQTMIHDGLTKAAQGVTTIEEVMRVIAN